MSKSNNTELQVFSGGLNLRPEPHLIDHSSARKLANVDIRSMALKPYRTPEFVQYTTGKFMYYFNSKLNFFDNWRSNITWNGYWYWNDINGFGKVAPDDTESALGITPPVDAPTVALATTNEIGLTGSFTYVYTYYDKDTGAESPPSPSSKEVTVDDGAILISALEKTTDYQIRLYRIGGVFTAYSAVETVNGQIDEYVDYKKFDEIDGMILDTLRAFPPPTGGLYLTESQGRFYCANGNKLYFSAPGKPDSWYLLDNIPVEETITMLAAVTNGVLICSKSKTWLLTGLDPMNFTKHLISQSEGCMSIRSLAVFNGQAIWLGENGFLMSNGSGVQDISTHKLGIIKNLDTRGAAMYNQVYICSFGGTLVPDNELVPGPEGGPDDDPLVGDLVPGATSGTSALPEGALVIDFSFGQPVFSTIVQQGLGDLGYYAGHLYQIVVPGSEESSLVTQADEQITDASGIFNIVINLPSATTTVNKMFTGNDLTRIRYNSPLLTEGSIGMLKQYEKVRITYYGMALVTILNDRNEVLQRQTLTSLNRVSEWIGIPVKDNRAYGIRIHIEGLCVVESIMYTWTPWEVQ